MNYALRTAEEMKHEFDLVQTISKKIKKLLEELLAEQKIEKELRLDTIAELGSGWELEAIEDIQVLGEIEYADINHSVMTPSTKGHAGKMVFAKIKDQYVLFLLGRVHHYEGYNPYEVVRMVRAVGLLQPKRFIFTNAAGGIHPSYHVGNLVVIKDHLPGLPSPLTGADSEFGPRHIGMGTVYSTDMRQRIVDSFITIFGGLMHRGVYASVEGPEFETSAQVIALTRAGADMVGMSTTQQVTALAQLNKRPHAKQIEIAAISLITNVAENGTGEINHENVLAEGKKAAGKGLKLIVKVIASYPKPKFLPKNKTIFEDH